MEDGAYSDCPFCRIVAGVDPADVVHSSDHVIGFRDTNAQAPVHILLIPRKHVSSAAELTADHGNVLADVFTTAGHLARAEGIDRSGWRLLTNVGGDAGQSVPHLHFHLLGGRPLGWPPG
jgi:histidine triad (HIT) family protein